MAVLLDTNILLRALQPDHPHSPIAENAVNSLRSSNEILWICQQNLVEFWAVATRPVADRGLGLSIQETNAELEAIKQHFPMVPETPLHLTWESLVNTYQVIGKNVHDARLVAAMVEHGLDTILTFNTQDFVRYASIRTLDPQTVGRFTGAGEA